MEDLIDLETKLSFKSKRLLDEYDLESLFDVSEYEAAIFEFKELIDTVYISRAWRARFNMSVLFPL